MSVMVLSDLHINTLVTYASFHGIKYFFAGSWHDVRGEEDETVKLLVTINETAFDVYYKNQEPDLPAPKFKYVSGIKSMDSVQAIKAAQCYEYQCDGWGMWADSKPKKLMEAITTFAINKLPGYDEAQWAIA